MLKDNLREIKQSFLLAYPVMLSQLGQITVGVADNIMVGRTGTVPLAGASLGNSVFVLFLTFGIGISYGITPLVAQADGEGKPRRIMEILKHGLWINGILSVILLLVLFPLSYWLSYFDQPFEVVLLAAPYTRILALSLIPFLIFQAFRQFAEGLSFTRQAMIITLSGNLVNIILNYILIYGKFGLPAMGLEGAGWATLLARCFMAITFGVYVLNSSRFKKYLIHFNAHFPDRNLIRNILNIGLPSGMQFIFEVGAFSMAAIMVGWFGAASLAAHQIAINMAALTYMMATGIAAATTIRVGNQYGKKNIWRMRKVGFIGFFMGGAFMAVNAVILIIGRHFFPTLYITDPQVIRMASHLLLIAAFFQLSDGIQVVGLGALRGMSDVKIPTLITLVAYWMLALPLGYIAGIGLDLGARGIWWGLLAGLSCAAILLFFRFLKITLVQNQSSG